MTIPLINSAEAGRASTGRRIKEDSSIVNVADLLEEISGNTDPANEVTLSVAQIGTPPTGETLPSGATGIRGVLGAMFGIVKNANDTVTVNPVTGAKTVTATAAAVFAGASVLASRKKLILRNEDPAIRVRVGPAAVTQQNGLPIEPGGTLEITFDPGKAIAIYAISEGAAAAVQVTEL